MLLPNTILQNRYRIIRQLGEGGMGTVYEALDQRVSAIVAIKETKTGTDAESRRAFEREAALLANLRHSSLPKVMDYFIEDDGDFLVMEFIVGYDLAESLRMKGGPFDLPQVLRWADELLKVLEYLHGRTPPIIHRDIKPSNLKTTKEGEIFLLDFGLAKGAAGQMTTLLTSRSIYGYTPLYASLEQIHGKSTDPRSDLYSLGATLYHLLTAVPPVDAPTRFDAVEDEKPDPLRPIEELNPNAPSPVATIIRQAMAISRKQRYSSASEMRQALREVEDSQLRSTEEEKEERLRKEDAERRRREEEERRKEEEQREEEQRRRAAQEDAARAFKAEQERQRQEEAKRLELERQQEGRRLELKRQREAGLRREQPETERIRRIQDRRRESKDAAELERQRLGLSEEEVGPLEWAESLKILKRWRMERFKIFPAPQPRQLYFPGLAMLYVMILLVVLILTWILLLWYALEINMRQRSLDANQAQAVAQQSATTVATASDFRQFIYGL